MPKKTERVRVLKIVDGDTVNVAARSGLMGAGQKEERVRLYGIDAPESDQQGGNDATKHLKKLVGGNRHVWLDRKETDRYGRTVGLIYHDRNKPADSYNYAMVRDGHAHVYMVAASERERYREAQTDAKSKNRGMWKNEKKMVMPTAHRSKGRTHQKRLGQIKWLFLAAAAAAAGYLILSNLDRLRSTTESVSKVING